MRQMRHFLWFFMMTVLSWQARGQGGSPSPEPAGQAAIYSAFILNVARYVRWPDEALAGGEAELVIGTLNRDPINDVMDSYVKNERVDRHPVRTLRIQSPEDLARCQVFFFSRSQAQQARAALAEIRGKPVLVITDAEGALELGGHVMLLPTAQRIRLRVHLANLKRSNLTASSQLLRLAEIAGR
jgi:hypothetical protein